VQKIQARGHKRIGKGGVKRQARDSKKKELVGM
jgi:hypothetical protein